jgi:hypothetical protein
MFCEKSMFPRAVKPNPTFETDSSIPCYLRSHVAPRVDIGYRFFNSDPKVFGPEARPGRARSA